MISGSPIATRFPVVQPLPTGVGAGVTSGDGSAVWLGVLEGSALTDGAALTDGDGDAETSQPVTANRTARRMAAGRRQPSGIGLDRIKSSVGVVLEPAHGGQGRVAEQLRLALEQGQLGAEAGRCVGRLEQALLA